MRLSVGLICTFCTIRSFPERVCVSFAFSFSSRIRGVSAEREMGNSWPRLSFRGESSDVVELARNGISDDFVFRIEFFSWISYCTYETNLEI